MARVQELFNELNEALNEVLEKLEMQRAAVAELQGRFPGPWLWWWLWWLWWLWWW